MPLWNADHPDMIAAFANAELREAGVDDLRFEPVFRSRRAAVEAGPIMEADLAAQERAQTVQEAPDAPRATNPQETPAQAMRARLAAVLRAPEAKGKADAALALALHTDMAAPQIMKTLRDLPEGVDLGLPPRAIADPDAKAEADRVRQIVTADAAQGHLDHALALAFDTDTPVKAALAILGAMPKPVKRASIEERFSQGDWFGETPTQMEDVRASGAAATWKKAVAKANAQFESAAPAAPKEAAR